MHFCVLEGRPGSVGRGSALLSILAQNFAALRTRDIGGWVCVGGRLSRYSCSDGGTALSEEGVLGEPERTGRCEISKSRLQFQDASGFRIPNCNSVPVEV